MVGIFWEGGVHSGRVAYIYICLKGGIFWDGKVNTGIRRHFIITKKGGGVDFIMEG